MESAQLIASVTAASGIAVGVFSTDTTFGSDEPEATTETYFIATPDGSFVSNVTYGPTGIANSSNLIDITAAAADTYEFSVYLDGEFMSGGTLEEGSYTRGRGPSSAPHRPLLNRSTRQ